jgi:hypothetical protein
MRFPSFTAYYAGLMIDCCASNRLPPPQLGFPFVLDGTGPAYDTGSFLDRFAHLCYKRLHHNETMGRPQRWSALTMDKLPIEYHLEVYESSFKNDPSIAWTGTTPFPTISVGEYFAHDTIEGWYNPPTSNQRFRVKEVEHIFWEGKDHIGHKLMVLLEVA